jgi:hypothetical protein
MKGTTMKIDIPDGMNIRGSVDISAKVHTVGDLREVVRVLDQIGVSDEANASESVIYIWLDRQAELIECGDHVPPEQKVDFLVTSHEHAKPVSQREWLGHDA